MGEILAFGSSSTVLVFLGEGCSSLRTSAIVDGDLWEEKKRKEAPVKL